MVARWDRDRRRNAHMAFIRDVQEQRRISWESWMVARWDRVRRRNALMAFIRDVNNFPLVPEDSDDPDWNPWAGLR